MEWFWLRSLLLLALVALVSACSPNKIYRDSYQACVVSVDNPCETAATSTHNKGSDNEFSLGFIEYDDQGQLRDRAQMQFVVDQYRSAAGQEDVIVTVFVHGWHHSAAPGDGNVKSFQDMLSKISEREARASLQQNRPKRKIIGVYIGWRGDSITLPLLQQATFWGRKAVAQEVGLQGVSEVLLKLEEIINVKAGWEEATPKPLNDRMIVMGHSFGGAVVYTSVQQILAQRYFGSERGKVVQGGAKGFGDLVILLNPAFEAMRYSTLYDIAQNCSYKFDGVRPVPSSCRNYRSLGQLPRLAVLTSEADWATRYAFPAGRLFSTLFESHADIERLIATEAGVKSVRVSESKADNTTIGHFEPYWTHRLDPVASPERRQAGFAYSSLGEDWLKQQYNGKLGFEDVELSHLGRSNPLNPYLNIYVNGDLISGHNDIWGDEVQKFLQDLIMISTTPITAD